VRCILVTDRLMPARKAEVLSTEQQIENMASLGMRWDAVAHVVGLSVATLSRRGYAEAMARGRAMREMDILMGQAELVKTRNPQMLIHLGRSVLGQSYKQELEIGAHDDEAADADETRRQFLRKLARIEAAEGAGKSGQEVESGGDGSAHAGLRLLGEGESEGADG
jgi:hypothetical protein